MGRKCIQERANIYNLNSPGKTEAAIKNFSPFYSRQYSVAFCNHVRSEVEQQRDLTSQFLKTKPPLEPGTVLYEAELSQFAEDIKKWKERYVVVKNDFAVESYENKEAYQRGAPPKSRILPAGGKVLTSEDEYSLLSDRHFPDPIASSEKENTQPFVVLPKEFPVYLWQPFLRHGYFCFQEAADQKKFSALLSDCIRHLNHDYTKQTTFEVQAFLEAVQFFRQEKGHYGSWEMITGDEVQILSHLVMEELVPTLQTDILPKMKGKKNDRKRAWFGLLEEAYNLVQHQVSEGLSALKEECRALTKGLEGTIRSDMDQIVNSKNFLIGKIKAMVAQPAEKSCAESVQPFLASILEELMGPVSSGFSEVRSLFEKEVDELSQNFQTTKDSAQLKEQLDRLMNLPLDSVKMEPCYSKVNLLQEHLQDLKSRFRFPHIDLVVQRTQNYMQELMENAVFTFEQLLSPHLQGDASKTTVAIEKVKLRVLKQYDYDSSTIRKRIFQEALVQITLPTVQKALASVCKPELQKYEQFIFADHTNMIHVENVYEEILHQILLDETLKVIKEAAILKKHNLFEDNMALPSESVSSLTDLKTPAGSNQASPARRASAILPEVSDSEVLSNEVFQESGEKKQPGVPSPVAKGESLSLPVPGPPLDGDGQVIISSIDDPVVSPVPAGDTAGALGTPSSEREFGETPEDQEATQAKPEPTSAPGCLKELRNLLTVTIEVPGEPAALEIEKDTNKETLVPQEIEKGEETALVYPEANQAAASSPDSCEESDVSEREAPPPAPPEAEAGGVGLGASPEAQPACEGLSEGAGGPGPTEEPAETGEPTERALTAGASGRDALEGGGPACSVEAEAVSQRGCTFRADPISPSESQGSVEEEAVGGRSSTAQDTASVEAEESKAAHGGACQWVVENDVNTDILDSQKEDPPAQPSEE
ncbi:protein Niban 1 isoform X2 [Hippopotamus amphibius kiboko]|uniref:protein Niban 1 isoform X2 n=1 Tax=Hippopotamus amphibius kiboko TaxID=575201 RepID=UPI0025990CBE|nr:protein Niban 1 isoform X2 [Hippopotamus amphibius kiboko]